MRDLRYAARTLRLAPGFTVAAVLTLAIGIGANSAMFSAVDGIVLQPLPFQQPARIVTVFQHDRKRGNDHDDVAPANFADWRQRSRAFSALAAAEPFALTVVGPEGRQQIYNWNVTQDFFTVLNARPAAGRLFQAADFAPDAERVLVLTYGSWQRRFGGDPKIVGRHLVMDRGPATIIGVLPSDFAYLQSQKMEMYAPKVLDTAENRIRNIAWWHVVGRLRPGVTVAQARDDMRRVAAGLSTEYPATNAETGVTVERLDDTIVGDTARALFLLLGAVGVVLALACANVASLMLARTARRRREFAMRAALGAAPSRVVWQVLTESLVIALLGGMVGTAIAWWSLAVIRAMSPPSLPRAEHLRLDVRAVAFTFVVVVIATFAFGLMPAWRAARPAGARALGNERRRHLRAAFVTTEIALAMILLVGAGLLIKSFIAVLRADRGYQTDHVLAATVFVYEWNPTPGARRRFIARLVDELATLPGVVAAGATSSLPLDIAIEADKSTFTIPGRPVAVGEEPAAHATAITPGAFAALRIEARRGRLFTLQDDSGAAPVAIVSEAFARRYWPDQEAIGRRVKLRFYGPPTERVIVGVVADVRQTALDAPVEPTLYVPHAQAPTGGVVLVVRTTMAPRRVARSLEAVVARLNPELPIAGIETLDELAATSLTSRRFTLTLFVCFALTALVLALIGVYGVVSQSTAERWREFGVRVALGARGADIIGLVMRQGFASAGIGIAIGVAGSAVLTTLLRGMLFEVVPLDLSTFGAVAVLMLTIALLACYVPARRATTVDPLVALRAEG